MTQLTPGKRYRWTVEGTADKYGYLGITKDCYLDDSQLAYGIVELLPDPLPTTPGSVVRWDDKTYLLMEDEWWAEPNGGSVSATLLAACNFTVLLDAGVDRA